MFVRFSFLPFIISPFSFPTREPFTNLSIKNPYLSLSFSAQFHTKGCQIMSSSSTPANYNPEGVDAHIIPTDQNVLQNHVAFFDRNHDGLVYPWETFQGFRAIGSGIILSTVAAFFINFTLSMKTRPGKFPSLLFPIEVKNIQRAKHGSDSGVYDSEGRFVPSKFEEIFGKHALTHPTSLTSDELMGMVKSNRVPKDYTGWFASYIEWKVLYFLCKDKNGLLQKETIKAVYDGSLFEWMEKERSSAKKKA